jgi:hypothetical protein
VGSNGNDGSDGHATDNTQAAGGGAPDINGGAGAKGGLCAGNGCTTSAGGANGVHASAGTNLDGSGGGGGGGSVVFVTMAASSMVGCGP